MDVGHAFHFLRQLGQLEVVGGKQGQGFDLIRQIFRAGPRQRQAIVGRGAAANFIHQHQAMLGGVMQNISGFGHLYHKG